MNKSKQALPNIVYYNDDHSRSPVCTSELSAINGATWTLPSTWEELTREIERGEDKIVFHIDMIAKSGTSIKEFIVSINTVVKFMQIKFMQNRKPLKIVVLTTPATTQQQVQELKDAGVLGLGYDTTYYSFEQAAEATSALIASKPYWPKHIISQLPNEPKKPLVLHFREDFEQHENQLEVHNSIQINANCRRIRVKSWSEFVDAVQKEKPEFITIHHTVIELTSYQLTEFIDSVRMMMQYLPAQANSNIPIAIGIDRTCDQQFISQLQKLNIAGIHPAGIEFGVDEAVTAVQNLLSGKSYWPEHIISQLPNAPDQLLSIYFRDDWPTYIPKLDVKKFKNRVDMTISYCAGWMALERTLASNPHQIVFHVSMLKRLDVTIPEIVSMLNTRLTLAGLDIPIGVGIEPDTPTSIIKELRQAGVFGLVPSAEYWGIDECVAGIHALRDRLPYWPKHIVDQLPGHPPKKVSVKKNIISISPRQQQVLDLIKTRGLGNKQIAKALAISEHTVKMHVGDIMRVYGVKSRVQLAVLA